MRRSIPLWLQLLGAFTAVILLAVGGLVALLLYSASVGSFPTSAFQGQALPMAVLLAGGAALLLGLALARRLAAPWCRLARLAQRWEEGKRGVRARAAVGAEQGQIGRCFNAMAEAIEQQEALRRQLLADLANELRAPLTVVQGNLEALLDGIYEPTHETLAPIHQEVRALARLVEDLRDLALAESGQLLLHREPVDLAELVRGVMAGVQGQAAERNIELPLLLPAGRLPPVDADPGRLRQALANLLAHALREVPQHGRVQVSLLPALPKGVGIAISDNGPGIAHKDLPYLFDRFTRAERSAGGLSLAIARQWIEAHGSKLRVESALGRGTTFSFIVPVVRPS